MIYNYFNRSHHASSWKAYHGGPFYFWGFFSVLDRDVKPPTTYEEQLKILKERNLIIPSQIRALEVLQKINYYRLSAYFLTFKQEDDIFKEGITFDKIYNLYEFDRKLRNLLMEQLESIEIAFRTHIAYYIAHNFGPLGYMESANFANEQYHSEFIDTLRKELVRRRKTELFVTHYDDFYGAKYPIWLAIEVMTFSQLSKLFYNLKNEDKNNIAKEHYQIPYTYIQNWLRVFSQIRNVCAHYGRLYNKNLVVKLSLQTKDANLVRNDKVFGVIFVLKKLIRSREEWLSFKTKLEALVEEYSDTIELKRIGFQSYWKDLL